MCPTYRDLFQCMSYLFLSHVYVMYTVDERHFEFPATRPVELSSSTPRPCNSCSRSEPLSFLVIFSVTATTARILVRHYAAS